MAEAPTHEAQGAQEPRRAWVEQVMGLPVSIHVRGPDAAGPQVAGAVARVHEHLHALDHRFSTYRADSEVSRLRAGTLAAPSGLLREVQGLCEHARQLTGGAFDARLPGGWDPSGLVKGWAVERAARGLDLLDGLDWLVNAGGDVLGRAGSGPAWQVAVEDPRDRTRVLGVLPLHAGAVATSGTAARGRHILDPSTGRPAPDQLLSATVTGPSLTWSDVLATAAFVEGTPSLARVRALNGYEALLVLPDGQLLATPGVTGQNRERAPSPCTSELGREGS